ncbi:MAG: transglycosylase SLT domain-containing protein [Desulfobulbales bacterium]
MGFIPSGVEWKGTIDLNLYFYVDKEWQLRYRITDSAIYDEDGSKALVSSFVWHISKSYLYPLLDDFSFDLAVPRKEIMALLLSCATPEDLLSFEEDLNTIQNGPLRVDAGGITVPLLLTLTDNKVQPSAAPARQKPLTEEELKSFQQIFAPLDAFLVFVVKTAGADFVDTRQRELLFDLLITSRYQLLSILAGEIAVETEDPLRILFVDAWQRLKLIIENDDGQNRLMQDQLLRYMTFINAGDALLVLDTAAPRLGLHITTDGLRRLARVLNPESKEDPLHFDWQVDPALQDLFKFRPDGGDETSKPARRLLEMLIGTARAAETVSPVSIDLGRRLDRWVPRPAELEEYTTLVEQLLQSAALEQIKRSGLDGSYSSIYKDLVPASALIESCWRQFTREDGRIVFLRSKSGSIGMMQINQHVWRGFYSIERLKWDVVYNIQAGTEILMRYFKDYGLEIAEKNGKPEYAARSAYSAYNAGPRAAQRFMKKNAAPREKKVDERLWSYFRAISAGSSVNLATCNVGGKPS